MLDNYGSFSVKPLKRLIKKFKQGFCQIVFGGLTKQYDRDVGQVLVALSYDVMLEDFRGLKIDFYRFSLKVSGTSF